MTLKSTITKPEKSSIKEVESVLEKVGMTDDSNTTSLINENVPKTTKINVILPDTTHIRYKTHCQINKVNMQDKAKQLIEEWLAKQPKLGI